MSYLIEESMQSFKVLMGKRKDWLGVVRNKEMEMILWYLGVVWTVLEEKKCLNFTILHLCCG